MMASYFDEHNCRPLESGQTPDHFLHVARLLLHGGYWQDLQLEFSQLFGEKPPPPASRECIDNLTSVTLQISGGQCPVCLKEWTAGDEAKVLPCKHKFHATCILPWLQKTNSCPMCRHELPTDDEDYESIADRRSELRTERQNWRCYITRCSRSSRK